MLSRLVTAFLPRSNCLNFMAAVTIVSNFGAQEKKIWHCFHFSHVYLPWNDRTGCRDLSSSMLSFKPAFSLSSFTFIKRLFSSSLLSSIWVISFAYLKLLIFFLEILIPACDSSSPGFHMTYSAYKLNMQGDNIQPWRTPFLIWNQFIVSCLVLTVASWSASRFLSRQIRWSGIPSLRMFHSLLWSIHIVKGFHIVNEAEVDVFLEFLCFFYGTKNVETFISGSSAFSKSMLYFGKFSVHILLKYTPILVIIKYFVKIKCMCFTIYPCSLFYTG